MTVFCGVSMGMISEIKSFINKGGLRNGDLAFSLRHQLGHHLPVVPQNSVDTAYVGAYTTFHPVVIAVSALIVTEFFICTAPDLRAAFETYR